MFVNAVSELASAFLEVTAYIVALCTLLEGIDVSDRKR